MRRVLADFDVPTAEEFATTFDTAMWRYYVESLAPRLLQDLATAYGPKSRPQQQRSQT